jgi:hypothetical protein
VEQPRPFCVPPFSRVRRRALLLYNELAYRKVILSLLDQTVDLKLSLNRGHESFPWYFAAGRRNVGFGLGVPTGNLELRLEPESVQKNIPKAFTVLIVNKSDHEVRLPMPSFESGDVRHGTVWLRLNFVPLKRGVLPELQAGGINDFLYQPISERVKGWKVLGPGESLNLETISGRILAQDAGSYDYWAYYYPPGMTKGDEEVLQKAGIDYPKKELESAHVKFVKKR